MEGSRGWLARLPCVDGRCFMHKCKCITETAIGLLNDKHMQYWWNKKVISWSEYHLFEGDQWLGAWSQGILHLSLQPPQLTLKKQKRDCSLNLIAHSTFTSWRYGKLLPGRIQCGRCNIAKNTPAIRIVCAQTMRGLNFRVVAVPSIIRKYFVIYHRISIGLPLSDWRIRTYVSRPQRRCSADTSKRFRRQSMGDPRT